MSHPNSVLWQHWAKDYTGYEFHGIKVEGLIDIEVCKKYVATSLGHVRWWLARCHCGRRFMLPRVSIGVAQSCGCKIKTLTPKQRIARERQARFFAEVFDETKHLVCPRNS